MIVEVSPNALALASYPDGPMSLSDSHFVAAYPVDRPAKMEFPQLAMIIQKHIKVRSTALALSKDNSKAKDTTLAVQAQPAASSSCAPDAPSYGDQFMMHLLATFQEASASILSGTAQREPVIEFLKSKSLASGSSESLVTSEKETLTPWSLLKMRLPP